MKSLRFVQTAGFAIVAVICASLATGAGAAPYRLIGTIRGPDFRWDYVSVDPAYRWLYFGRIGGVTKIDLRTGRVTPTLIRSALVHGVAPIGETGLAAASNGLANTITLFRGSTGAVIGRVKVGEHPDAVVYEPHTDTVLTFNAVGDDATVVDWRRRVAVATIALGGRPEFPAADGRGLVYDNITDCNEIAVIDVASRKVLRRIPLPGCREPTGLAYDEHTHMLISACSNGRAEFVDAADGKVTDSIPIGRGPDAVILDARRRRAFIPSGGTGTLSIFDIAGGVRLQQTLRTEPGVRTGAVDPVTGTLYLPSARFLPASRPGAWPAVAPGTFRLLVLSRAATPGKGH